MHSTSTSTWRHLKYSMMSLWIVWINSIPVRLDRRVNQTRNGESDQNKRRVFIHLWALLFSLAQFCFASFSFRFASFFSFFFFSFCFETRWLDRWVWFDSISRTAGSIFRCRLELRPPESNQTIVNWWISTTFPRPFLSFPFPLSLSFCSKFDKGVIIGSRSAADRWHQPRPSLRQ